jgi:3',5'-cyclic AMP phosphodiesterase CpdA
MIPTRRALIATGAALATTSTLPALAQPATASAFRLVFMPCIHLRRDRRSSEGLAAALQAVEALDPRPRLIVTGGDLCHDLRSQSYEQAQEMLDLFKRIWADNTRIPTRHLLGNHDWVGWSRPEADGSDPRYGLGLPLRALGMERNWYAFDEGGWRFVLLDDVDMTRKGRFVGTVPEDQLAFLRAQVTEDPRRPVLVFTHVPIITATEFYGGRAELRDDTWRLASNRLVDNSRAVLDAVQGGNVRAFASGHIHELDRIEVAGHRFICSGAVSGQQWGGQRIAGPLGTPEGFGVFDLRPDGSFDYRYQTYGWRVG